MDRTSITCAVALFGVALTTAMPVAHAGDGAGAFRLALSADVFGWEGSSFGEVLTDRGAVLVPAVSSERLRIGLLDPRLGIQLGGAIIPELLIGVTGAVARTEDSAGTRENEAIDWLVLAWIEGAFLPDGSIRPFVRGSIGGGGAAESVRDGMTTTSATQVLFAVSLTAGAHFFVSDDVSISPWLQLGYRAGGASVGAGSVTLSRSLEIASVALGVTLSGWIGGAPASVAEPTAAQPRWEREDAVPIRHAGGADDTFRTEFRIPGTLRARLGSRPRVQGRDIQLGFSMISPSPRFGGCEVISIESGERRVAVPMRVTQRPFQTGVEETVVLTANHAQIELLVGPSARLVACGAALDFDASARAAVRAYVLRFRALATSARTLDESATVELPAVEPPAVEVPVESDDGAPLEVSPPPDGGVAPD